MAEEEEFVPTVRCPGCKRDRPDTSEPCPHCGADAYPHRTDRDDFADRLRAVDERDRIGRAIRGDGTE
jgi:predicted amidophosphoribosyltransferase